MRNHWECVGVDFEAASTMHVHSNETLFLFCYESDFMMSLSDDKQADVIDAFNTTSKYLDDILNINNVYFENMVSQIYPSELQLNKANASDTEAAFLDLHLSISNDIVSTKNYDKRDDFDFEIVNFPFLDGDVPRSTSYGVYISQLIRFARASSYVTDFNTRNKLLTQKLLKQGYRYHKLRKTFSKFYRRYYDLISKFQVGLKSLLRQGLSEPDFYGDLVYKLKKIVGSNNFSAQFIKIISHYKKIGYNINVLQQTACLVVNPFTVGNFAFLFNCTPVGRTSDSMMVPTYKDLSIDEMVGACVGPTGVYLLDFFCSGIQFNLLLSPYPCFISLLYLDLYVLGDDALIS